MAKNHETLRQLRATQRDHVARSLPEGATLVGHTEHGEQVYRLPLVAGEPAGISGAGPLRVLLSLHAFNAEVRKLARTMPTVAIGVQPTSTWHPTWTLIPLASALQTV